MFPNQEWVLALLLKLYKVELLD